MIFFDWDVGDNNGLVIFVMKIIQWRQHEFPSYSWIFLLVRTHGYLWSSSMSPVNKVSLTHSARSMLIYILPLQLQSSNGNDIEAKRNEASILRHFLYRSETIKLILKLWRIEAKRTEFSPLFTRSKRKRTGLVQNFAGSKRNEPV